MPLKRLGLAYNVIQAYIPLKMFGLGSFWYQFC